MKLREDKIHYIVRQTLRKARWQLIAGQYPNGSDDELLALCITDPAVACDNSPDHRRHSENEVVPDLLACKNKIMLIIEMKPLYSAYDEQKLEKLLSERRQDLLRSLKAFQKRRILALPGTINELVFVPCLAFSSLSSYQRNPLFCYFLVKDDGSFFIGNDRVPSIES